MKVLIVISIIFLTGCSSPNEYNNSIADLGLGFISKEMCSCLFVANQNETFCRDYVKIRQISPDIEVLKEKKQVIASLFWIFKRSAKLQDDSTGCQIN